MNIRYSIFLIAILWLGFSFNAYSQYKHEFSVSAAGGISTLDYTTNIGKGKVAIGGLAGIEYTFFISKKVGIGTGAELASYNSKFEKDKLSYSQFNQRDTENDPFNFYSTIENYQEKQNAMMVNIPLKVQYQSGVKKHILYASLGGKIGLPVSGKAKLDKAKFINKGYYPEIDNWLETQEFMGFGTYTKKKFQDDLVFKTAYLVTAEAGVKWRLTDKLALYTGGYIDYGLNEIFENKAPKHYYVYNAEKGRDFKTNTIMKSYFINKDGKKVNFNEKVKPMAVGIKVKLTFGIRSKVKPKVEEELFPVVLPDSLNLKKSNEDKDLEMNLEKSNDKASDKGKDVTDKPELNKDLDNQASDKKDKGLNNVNDDSGLQPKDANTANNDNGQGKKGDTPTTKPGDLKPATGTSKTNRDKGGDFAKLKGIEDLAEKEANKGKENDKTVTDNTDKSQKGATDNADKSKKDVSDNNRGKDSDKDNDKGNRLDANKPKEFTADNREILECITDGYDVNKANLSDENQEKLQKVVEYLKKYPSVNIYCEGNTCDLGGVTLNYNLGMVRAMIVKEYLTNNGIESRRVKIESKGKYNMKYKNTSEDNRKLNRRVEITIDN